MSILYECLLLEDEAAVMSAITTLMFLVTPESKPGKFVEIATATKLFSLHSTKVRNNDFVCYQPLIKDAFICCKFGFFGIYLFHFTVSEITSTKVVKQMLIRAKSDNPRIQNLAKIFLLDYCTPEQVKVAEESAEM